MMRREAQHQSPNIHLKLLSWKEDIEMRVTNYFWDAMSASLTRVSAPNIFRVDP